MKHTKGPWNIRRSDKIYTIDQTKDLDLSKDSDLDQLDSNMLLMAAAPDLLDLLIKAEAVLDRHISTDLSEQDRKPVAKLLKQINEAICKARGEE